MITIQQLRWANAFSYAGDNSIDFSRNSLTQLVGKNGHGKSSIALILEEVLFNKNSKGIKKGDILNRHIKDKTYNIELFFNKDGTEYRIETKRGSTQTVKLFKGDRDISSHTATATYKQIEDIIGMDHKTFAQIVYQSHAGSLEFLTAPDTARKKFLIELLNLGKYTKAGEVFKGIANDLSKELSVVQGKVDTIVSWIDKYKTATLDTKPLTDVPEVPSVSELEALVSKLNNVEATNKRIVQNNTYKELEKTAKAALVPVPDVKVESEEPFIKEIASANTEKASAVAFVSKMSALKGTCPTCLSSIDENKVQELIKEKNSVIENCIAVKENASAILEEIKATKVLLSQAQKAQQDWEKYHNLIQDGIPDEVENAEDIQAQVTRLKNSIASVRLEITRIEKENAQAIAHNSKVEVIKSQVQDMTTELEEWSEKLLTLSNNMSVLNTLLKVFSTTGLVAYKIENLVKDLEEITNEYLGELSGGRFQISFQISGSDKLNVIVTDNGIDIDIMALSGGERARVNVAALLAIRKLMQSLSQTRINLLILDETIESLDVDGKEKLIEVLLREEYLNTVLVSHGFSHPLLEKINVVKHNNISTLEE